MNILLLAGSNRKASSSTKLLRYMELRLRDKGAGTELFDLYERPLPPYSPDRDKTGDPEAVALLQAAERADALVIASPEYHGTMSGVLKNALDYLDAVHVSGKPVLSVASAGGAVGVSTLTHLQAVVRSLHGINSPEWVSIGGENRKFGDEDGAPLADGVKLRTERALDELLRLTELLRNAEPAARGR